MKRKLELSVSEMRQLREDGYSNVDIARILDISVATVYNYIGKQGYRIPTATASFANKPKEAEAPPAPQIAVVSRVVSVDGYLFELPSMSSGMSVTFADGQNVKIDDADRFIKAFELAKQYRQYNA